MSEYYTKKALLDSNSSSDGDQNKSFVDFISYRPTECCRATKDLRRTPRREYDARKALLDSTSSEDDYDAADNDSVSGLLNLENMHLTEEDDARKALLNSVSEDDSGDENRSINFRRREYDAKKTLLGTSSACSDENEMVKYFDSSTSYSSQSYENLNTRIDDDVDGVAPSDPTIGNFNDEGNKLRYELVGDDKSKQIAIQKKKYDAKKDHRGFISSNDDEENHSVEGSDGDRVRRENVARNALMNSGSDDDDKISKAKFRFTQNFRGQEKGGGSSNLRKRREYEAKKALLESSSNGGEDFDESDTSIGSLDVSSEE